MIDSFPRCDRKSCFANEPSSYNGAYVCTVLTDNDFHGKPCPFYKTWDQFAKEREDDERRKFTEEVE